MSFSLRVLLIAGAFLVCLFVVKKIKAAQMQVLDSLFWLLFSASFIILGVFPDVASAFSNQFGFISTSNFVFLYVIAVLVIRDFCNSLRISKLEDRLNSFVQAVALKETDNER